LVYTFHTNIIWTSTWLYSLTITAKRVIFFWLGCQWWHRTYIWCRDICAFTDYTSKYYSFD